ICLGSSDFRRTGAYKENSFIVTSLESCAPCSHSANCSKSSHLCGESINVEAVGLLMHQILNGGSKEIKILAKEYSDSLKIYKTFFNHSGFWFARDLAKGFDSEDLEQVINLSSWKLLNQGEHLKLIGEYGSEGVKLNAAIHQAFPEIQNSIKQRFFSDLESRTTQDGENLLRIRGQLQNLLKNQDFNNKEIVRNFKLLQEELSPKLAEEILQFISNFSGNPSIHFTKIRKFTEAMQSAFNRNQIQLKLIRTMMNQRMVGL
ncbi:MAG: hypothetical protein KDD40_09890, partial [Bdellovibrionales bacterium]|nr:hypothetical protein [Bdellovibrionales bacterium]